MNSSPGIESEIRRSYSAARSGIPEGVPVAALHIGAEQTAVASGMRAQPGAIIILELGSHRTARDYFRHAPPAAIEIENAIMGVEDALTRVRAAIAEHAALFTTDGAIAALARMAGIAGTPPQALPLDAVERTYARLAALALGRPATQDALLASGPTAATLLILREFMHHAGFASITVQA